jgi:anti-sigma regulatory factor (Ser/Thr protein kinase)
VHVDHGPQGPAQARSAVERWAHAVGVGRLCDDLVLIVSELVTNAVRHGAPPVRVEVQADDRTVTVSVVDAAPGQPQRRTPSADAEGGRGLLLIDLLAAEHGVRPDPPGKVVWAALAR